MSASAPSRRALLGAAILAPVGLTALSAAPVPVSASAAWKAAWTAYQRAGAKLEAFDRDHMRPATDRFMAVRNRWPISYDWRADPEAEAAINAASADYDPLEARYDDLNDASWDAFDAMAATPAPTLASLRSKVHAAVEREAWSLGADKAGAVFGAVLSDLDRLTGARS